MSDVLSYKDLRWEVQPTAESTLREILDDILRRCPSVEAFRRKIIEQAGVRLRDIVDHISCPRPEILQAEAAGWLPGGDGAWRNPTGLFPPLVDKTDFTLWLRVESVDVFLRTNGLPDAAEGKPHGPMRRAIVFAGDGVQVGVIERHGHAGFDLPEVGDALIRDARLHHQAFRARRRQFSTVDEGLGFTEGLVDAAVADIGPHWACSLWLTAEREYWMQRCAAGRQQKERQDRIGIGWANIDHHTYDGSRRHFHQTIRILEKLGYELREMLYAGELAGWGSQVLEQPVIGSTIFADVDLAPHELTIDFAHTPLPDLPRHRRAGLLSELLGESILEAGLNHVAGLYDQRALRALLGREGVRMMSPFSDMPRLYQELTEGDWGPVDPAKVDALEAAGHIDAGEAERLRLEGSIITHLENIERNDGFKGFNRQGIDDVLRKLDPRAYLGKQVAAQ